MNINLNIPPTSLERLLSALERIATATERIAGPVIEQHVETKPFAPELWGTSSNAQSRQIEEEDRWEAAGYGAEYQSKLESVISAANRLRDIADANREG